MGRGRPPGSLNKIPAKGPRRRKNVTLDEDAHRLLFELGDAMEIELGFKPTASQTLRNLIHKYNKLVSRQEER
jgi:hypothetical protein